VAFSYVPERPLIRNLNLEVKPGQRVAIVGPTGSGKTTVINLLMRFYDVDSGSIKVEGIDIRNITRQSLRENYGMVLQDTWLKSGTIRRKYHNGKTGRNGGGNHCCGKSRSCPQFYQTAGKRL